jgi:hypothetical protein
MFGFFRNYTGFGSTENGTWTDICGVDSALNGQPINGPSNASKITNEIDSITAGAATSALTCCPAALTVQIINPSALQTTSGIVYAGVMNTQAAVAGRTETWGQYMERFVRFQGPRMMSAGKLALRGVMINSYPMSMSQISEFTPLTRKEEGGFTYTTATINPEGFAPILVFNPSAVNLEYLVTQEWRVRFDLDNPASAAHVHHPIASDWTWDSLMRKAAAMGHGVRDIVEAIADGAAAVQGATKLMALGN